MDGGQKAGEVGGEVQTGTSGETGLAVLSGSGQVFAVKCILFAIHLVVSPLLILPHIFQTFLWKVRLLT